jgi:isoleucyl-tRNA synthetase
VQQARREADLNVSDRITVLVQGDGLDEALAVHGAFVAGETLADAVEVGAAADGFAGEVGDGQAVLVKVAKV